MPLFRLSAGKLSPINEAKIDLERDLQRITEANLQTIFGLTLVDHEFALHDLRIDTLAFDEETKSFVIIEYKRDRSSSVVDQGVAYLSLVLNNRADFVLQYNEKRNGSLKKSAVDWQQSRVLFLSNSFTVYQQTAINFRDLPIELWEVKQYDNGILSYNQLKPSKAMESIKVISTKGLIKTVAKQVKTYSVEDHFKTNWATSREIFEALRTRLIELDSRLEEKPRKFFIGYGLGRPNVVNLRVFKTKVVLDLLRSRPEDLKDPENRVVYMKNSPQYYNQHISMFTLKSVGDVDYAVFLAKQVYDAFSRNQ